MYKVIVNVPAAMTNLGPGLTTLGLGLALHTRIEMVARRDDRFEVTVNGYGQESLPEDFRNPVVRAAVRLFQMREMAPVGLSVTIDNRIPLGIGLETEASLMIGGLVAANNLIDGDYEREGLVTLAAELGIPHIVSVTTLFGGLNMCVVEPDGDFAYNSLEPPPMRVVIVAPELPEYMRETAGILPANVRMEDAVFNLSRVPFLIDALLDGDYKMVARMIQDRLYQHVYAAHIPGYEKVLRAAHKEGATAITMVGTGPALMAFAPYNHNLIATSMVSAFQEAGVQNCAYWTLGLDSQGVTVSVAQ